MEIKRDQPNQKRDDIIYSRDGKYVFTVLRKKKTKVSDTQWESRLKNNITWTKATRKQGTTWTNRDRPRSK